MAKGRKGEYRRTECPSFWDQDLMLNPYTKFSQVLCKHRQSPNCLRQRCLEDRKIPFEVRYGRTINGAAMARGITMA